MKYLLTGACGFIGSNIAFNLVREGHQVLNLDKLTYASNTKGFEKIPEDQYRLLVVDVSKLLDHPDLVQEIKTFQPDYVIHLAAESMVDRSLDNNRVFFESNVLGTWSMLELLRTLNLKKAIFFSTDEVYGALHLEKFQINNYLYGFREEDRLDPRNPYAGSKAAADQVTQSYIHNFGLPICMIRPTNNFGPRQDAEKLIPKAITNILGNKKVPIYGKGTCYFREWLYVDDTYTAVKTIMERGQSGKIYNIGSGSRCNNLEVIGAICKILDTKLEDVVEYVTDRVGHDSAYAANSRNIRELGWKPQVNLEQGLINTVNHYKALISP